jgi:hypothetical protein
MCVSCCDSERRPLTFVPFLLHGDVTDYVCITTQTIEHEPPTASPHLLVLCMFCGRVSAALLATASYEAEWYRTGRDAAYLKALCVRSASKPQSRCAVPHLRESGRATPEVNCAHFRLLSCVDLLCCFRKQMDCRETS